MAGQQLAKEYFHKLALANERIFELEVQVASRSAALIVKREEAIDGGTSKRAADASGAGDDPDWRQKVDEAHRQVTAGRQSLEELQRLLNEANVANEGLRRQVSARDEHVQELQDRLNSPVDVTKIIFSDDEAKDLIKNSASMEAILAGAVETKVNKQTDKLKAIIAGTDQELARLDAIRNAAAETPWKSIKQVCDEVNLAQAPAASHIRLDIQHEEATEKQSGAKYFGLRAVGQDVEHKRKRSETSSPVSQASAVHKADLGQMPLPPAPVVTSSPHIFRSANVPGAPRRFGQPSNSTRSPFGGPQVQPQSPPLRGGFGFSRGGARGRGRGGGRGAQAGC